MHRSLRTSHRNLKISHGGLGTCGRDLIADSGEEREAVDQVRHDEKGILLTLSRDDFP